MRLIAQKFKRYNFTLYIMFALLMVVVAGCSSSTNISPTSTSLNVSASPKKDTQTANSKTSDPNSSTVSSQVSTQVKAGDKLKVSYIDVGQADSILVQIPNGKNLLIDTGNREDYGTISSYLNKQGVNKIDTLVLTHMHEDHIGSSPEIIKINNIVFQQLLIPGVQGVDRYKIWQVTSECLPIIKHEVGRWKSEV